MNSSSSQYLPTSSHVYHMGSSNRGNGDFRQASTVTSKPNRPSFSHHPSYVVSNNENVSSNRQSPYQSPQEVYYQPETKYIPRAGHKQPPTSSSNHSYGNSSSNSSSIATVTAVAAVATASAAATSNGRSMQSSLSSPSSRMSSMNLPTYHYQPQNQQSYAHSWNHEREGIQGQYIPHNSRMEAPHSPNSNPRMNQSYPTRSESSSPHPHQQSRYTPQPRSEYIPPGNQKPLQASPQMKSSLHFQPPPSPTLSVGNSSVSNQRQMLSPSPTPSVGNTQSTQQHNQGSSSSSSAFAAPNEVIRKRLSSTPIDTLYLNNNNVNARKKGPSLLPRESGSTSTVFGTLRFSNQDVDSISSKLQNPLLVDEVMVRRGPAGKKLLYISHECAVNHANTLFGWDGWSFEVIDFDEHINRVDQDKYRVSVRLLGAVILKNGMFKKDFGFGSSVGTLADAWEMSFKTASSDCQKRCLRLFGSYLGNCLYNKEFHDELLEEKMKTNPRIL